MRKTTFPRLRKRDLRMIERSEAEALAEEFWGETPPSPPITQQDLNEREKRAAKSDRWLGRKDIFE